MKNNFEKFVQQNSPDGGFLQSEEWRGFQGSVGRKTHHLEGNIFWANIIEHVLPVVGKYFYVPRGPVMPIHNSQFTIHNQITKQIQEIIDLAKQKKAGWVRIEPASEEVLKNIKNNIKYRITKAPHDVQPKEIFVIDIAKSEAELLAEMKSKTRYNIKLAEKKEVKISNDKIKARKYIEEFLRLVKITATRDGIVSHPENYYRQMLETIPGENLKLYIAEYQDKVIAANLVLFYGDTCTYMHGASDNENRNVMAPYALQWQQIKDAKKNGCTKYDFGGVADANSKWSGITRFKTGFSPETASAIFPGSYDIIINKNRYYLYRLIQKIKK